jgi:hypothetical protein
MKKIIITTTSILVAACLGFFVTKHLVSSRTASDDYSLYVQYIREARTKMGDHDSSSVVIDLLNKAESISMKYSGTERAGMFGDEVPDIKDSLFVIYTKQFEFFYKRYINFACTDKTDKQKALNYIDKALEIKPNEYLETMKKVLI